ncbi:redoxin domain-containing protein [Microbulbifer sp. TYP-18]|uniref:redoxin domain-containing protein n=1 Tax=Microbulbifer sp. TYP-18 TaxID=3230024 RepID=UPI0034C63582
MAELTKAPELCVQTWLNTDTALSLDDFREKVVALFVFQMLCPGCVQHSIPQAGRVHSLFDQNDVVVIGLHSVFEHHAAMTEVSLKAFLHEFQIEFPVAIDMPSGSVGDPIPKTMRAYGMGGTPTLILIDRQGYLRKQKMGYEQDLTVGAELMALIREP